MKPKKFISTIVAGIFLIVVMATNFVVPIAHGASIPAEATSILFDERNSTGGVVFWVGDILKPADEPIVVWSNPELSGGNSNEITTEQFIITEVLGDNIYELYIPKANGAYYAKIMEYDAVIVEKQILQLRKAKSITFFGPKEEGAIRAAASYDAEIISYLEEGQVIEKFQLWDSVNGWIKLTDEENVAKFVNLRSYRWFTIQAASSTTTTTTTQLTTTTTKPTTTTTKPTTTTTKSTTTTTKPTTTTTKPTTTTTKPTTTTTKPTTTTTKPTTTTTKSTTTTTKPTTTTTKLITTTKSTTTTTKPTTTTTKSTTTTTKPTTTTTKSTTTTTKPTTTTTKSTTTTTKPTTTTTKLTTTMTTTTTTSTTTTTELTTTTESTTTTIVTTPDVPVFEENSVVKFIGKEWGERTERNLNEEAPKKFTPDNPYITLGEYLGDGWYEVEGNGTYINISGNDAFWFEEITCSYAVGTKLLFLGEEWNVREEAAWGENVQFSFKWITEVEVLEAKGNWHKVQSGEKSGWIFIDPRLWVEKDSTNVGQAELFNIGDELEIKSSDPWNLREGRDWSDEAILTTVPKKSTVKVIKVVKERWFIVEYKDCLYYMNIPNGQEKWFVKKNI